MDLRLQNRKDRLLDQLKGIAATIQVNDINVDVGKKTLENSYDDRDAPRATTKFEIAQKIPDEPIHSEEDEKTEISDSKKVRKHLNNYKIKGKFEKFLVKQNVRRWRDIAQNITRNIQKQEDEKKKEFSISGFKIMRDDIWRQIKKFVTGHEQENQTEKDERKTFKRNMIDHVGRYDRCEQVAQKTEHDIKKFLPFCNNVVLTKVQKANI